MKAHESRLRKIEAALDPDWRQSEGLCALLAAAKALPRRDPWEMPDLEGGGSMGQLLAHARQWQEEQAQGDARRHRG